jgi:alpha-beta hydrolase superfamily lysophospholipase
MNPDILRNPGLLLLLSVLLCGCATPWVEPAGSQQAVPRLKESYAVMNDGYRLPVRRWEAETNSRAVVLALHGLNDYGNAFAGTGAFLAARGITLLAYDQRGFGDTEGRAVWHGVDRMVADVQTMMQLVRQNYVDKPLFLLGESMGGAVVLASLAEAPTLADGIILVAPAVWSRATMPLYQRLALWIAAHTVPDKPLTGEGLELQPSDNIEMLRALSRDPLVIKETRVDVLYGISNLMDTAAQSREPVKKPVLILYGLQDDIIPRKPACHFFLRLVDVQKQNLSIVLYADGYHMLTRDLQGDTVLNDINRWTSDRNAYSDQQAEQKERIGRLCGAKTKP